MKAPLPTPTPSTRNSQWLCLLLGAALLPWITAQTVIPLAAWLAPIFLLRFVRSRPAVNGLLLVVLAHAGAQLISVRNGLIPIPPGPQLYAVASAMGVVLSLGYVVDRLLSPRLRGLPRTLIFPCGMVSVDLLLNTVSPYGLFGSAAYSQFGNLPLLQIVSVTGIWGVTFLMAWAASVANTMWEENFDVRSNRLSVGLFTTIMIAVLLLGGVRLAFFAPAGSTVQVAGLAPNRPLSDAFKVARVNLGGASPADRAAARVQYLDPLLNDLFARTEQAAAGGAKIVAWAEAAAFVLAEDEDRVIERGQAVARAAGIYLQMALIPILATDHFPFVANRAVLIGPDGVVLWRYDKSKPVPGDGHLPGPGIVPTVDTPYGRLSTVICFDADFPSLVQQAGAARADILLVPSSDWETVAETHARMATFRALENGVTLVRATRQGTSLAVDYEGRLLAYNPDYFVADTHTLIASVPTRGVATAYSRIGDAFAYLCVAGLLSMVGFAVFRRGAERQLIQSDR